MVWPSLISVADAPGPYFAAWAKAPGPMSAAATAAAAASPWNGRRESRFMVGAPVRRKPRDGGRVGTQGPWRPKGSMRTSLAAQPRPDHADEPGHAGRHHVHEADQEDAVDRPRRRLRDLVG